MTQINDAFITLPYYRIHYHPLEKHYMSTPETIVLLAFILLAIYIIIGLFRSILESCRHGEFFYQKLVDRIKPLRMHKMLQALGISEEKYSRGQPVTEIEMHMNRCKSCANTEQCDAELESGEIKHADQYCPNNGDLLKHQNN